MKKKKPSFQSTDEIQKLPQKAFMCSEAFYERHDDMAGGRELYNSVSSLKKESEIKALETKAYHLRTESPEHLKNMTFGPCWEECGIMEVEIKFKRWVVKPKPRSYK